MPDTISISASVSLGLLAGIVSGVCYLVANGVTWNKCEEEDSKACVRGAEGAGEGECRRCGGETRGGIIPCICQHKLQKFESGGWFLRQLHRAMYHMPWGLSTDRLEQIDEECETGDGGGGSRGGDLRNVREFLEALSERLAGGDLAATSVAPLYHHHQYLPPSSRSTPVSASSDVHGGASSAHAQLKRLVSRVVEEAAALPALARYAAEPPHMPSLESSTYEDLLASAILNKVIERYQTENGSGGRSSGIHSASASPTPSERSSPRSLNQRHTREVSPSSIREEDDASDWEEGDASEEALEVPRRVPFPEFGGDIIHPTDNEERDFDEVSSSDIQAVDGSWEENWLFQKKKIKTLQSVPVPMLVPNSNTEYRAMIGDRDADDTTDLSDNASDTEAEARYRSNTKRVLESKHLIGGKPKIEEVLDFEPDSLTFIDGSDDFIKFDEKEYMKGKDVVDSVSPIKNEEITNGVDKNKNIDNSDNNNSVLILGIDSGPLDKAEFVLKEEIHRTTNNNNHTENNSTVVNGQNKNGEDVLGNMKNYVNGSIVSRHEREGEYEETVTLPVQRYADSLRRKHFDDERQQIPTRDTDIEDELLPGTIAYRERKKWLNAVEMPNNPYSPEAIQRRLSAKSTSSMFDTLTAKSKGIDPKPNTIEEKTIKSEVQSEDGLEKDKANVLSLTVNGQINGSQQNGGQNKSPSPKILKDALAEEVPQYKRYGRDYYIKEAKIAAGARKRGTFSDTSSISSINKSVSLENFEPELTSPGLLIKQFNTIATNQQYTNFDRNNLDLESITTKPRSKSIVMIEYDDNIDTNILYSAQPAHVKDDTDKQFEAIFEINDIKQKTDQLELISLDANSTSFETADLSTSSLDDSIKIYNVPTGEIVKSKHFDNVSVVSESTTDKNENFDIPDNNIREDTVDSLSQSSDSLVDALVIIDSDNTDKHLGDDIIVDYNSEVEEILSQLPRVKEIAKKFVSMDNLNETVKVETPSVRRTKTKENIFSFDKPVNKQMYMHSLTARSISKEFREELKQSMTTPLKIPGGSKEIPEGIEEVVKESSRPGSPLPEPGTIKTKLAFFESLKNKFSSK